MSKFFKFKPALTIGETSNLLVRLTGEEITPETILELVRYFYLTPVLCYGSLAVGFDNASTKLLFSGEKASASCYSTIGVVSCKYAVYGGVEACAVEGTNGELFSFFLVNADKNGFSELKKEFEISDLKPISTPDLDTYFFSYEEIIRFAELANDESKFPPPPIMQPLSVRFSKPCSSSELPSAEELLGLQTDTGSFAISTSAKSALTHDAIVGKKMDSRERKSASQIIAVLAEMAGLNLSAPYAADETLRAFAAGKLELPSSPETVVKFLKDAVTRAGKA